MAVVAQPDVAPPPKLSIVGAFRAAPTLVKILVAYDYLGALMMLGWTVYGLTVALGHGDSDGLAGLADDSLRLLVVAVVPFLGLAFAAIPFLLGKGMARGAFGAWLLSLILGVFALPLFFLLDGLTASSIFGLVVAGATLALLLTPAVRQHCARK